MVEKWVAIEGFAYEVSDAGRVRRADTRRVLSPGLSGSGYPRVSLCRDGVITQRYVHDLVMCAFVGPRPIRAVINHVDGNKSNNKRGNLEYTSHRRNIREAVRMGLQPIGERHPNAKLRDVDVEAIRACARAGKSLVDIAAFFGVRAEHVGKIANGRRRAS